MISVMRAKSMFSSWSPISALVAGVKIGSGSLDALRSPGGSATPQTERLCWYSCQPLPAGLHNASKLPEPIFTPATKAEMGDHDENIDFARMGEIVGAELAARIRDIAVQLYQRAAALALNKGIIIADTKFEFGLDADGTLTLMDEVLTPDSSRFWPVEGYAEGINPPSYDKQFVRDWLEQARVDGQPWNKKAPAPALPADVIAKTADKYREALRRLLT